MASVGSLTIVVRVKIKVVQNDNIGTSEADSKASSFGREKENFVRFVAETEIRGIKQYLKKMSKPQKRGTTILRLIKPSSLWLFFIKDALLFLPLTVAKPKSAKLLSLQ